MFITPDISASLRLRGYAVIPNVISEEVVDSVLSDFQAFHAHATGQQFDSTYYDRALEFKNVHGIIEFPGALSHTHFVNRIRQHPHVLQVFAEIHGVNRALDPILMSYDRVNYQASMDMRKLHTRDRKSWWHIDQSWTRPYFDCVQGYVDIVGSETDDHGGLMVLEGSHFHFENIATAYHAGLLGNWTGDWYRVDDELLDYLLSHCSVVNVKCPKGGMVLWDSRTVHMSRPNRHAQDERFVIYTCGLPKSRFSAKDLLRREEAKRMRRATTAQGRQIFPAKPQWFGSHSEEPQQIAELWM
jgi:ectoine hydroxylase-related dioxygenase (phytanoyl-CoA dioxygenase family)